MKNGSITIGFSGNPGLYFDCEEGAGEKGYINDFAGRLEGSTANFANLLKIFGLNPNVLIPFPIEDSLKASIFDYLLDRSGLPITRLHVLEEGPLAKIDNGKLFGVKGVVTRDEQLLQEAESQILRSDGLWRIANGINSQLIRFAQTLFSSNHGHRTLSPHHTLCSNPALLSALLEQTDMLILNKHEFELTGFKCRDIHRLGVSLIVVTDAERGGYFSLANMTTNNKQAALEFRAVSPSAEKLFSVGAGDCFNAAFHVRMFTSGFSFKDVPVNIIIESCNFAAQVSAIKITKEGASNVPTLQEIEEKIKKNF